VTLNISTLPSKEGNAEMTYKSLDTFSFPMRKAFVVSVNVYANEKISTLVGDKGYYNVIESIINASELETYRSILRQAGISYRNNSEPVDLSELLESIYEFRASTDLFMAYIKVVNDVVGQIDKVNLKGTVGDFETIQDIPES
jgi:hypothetical protein